MKVYLAIVVIVLVSIFILVQCNPMKEAFYGPQDQTLSGPQDQTLSPGEEEAEQPQTQMQTDLPFTTAPINDLDDYEHSLIFKNEGAKGMTKATRDLLMSSYPMDWSTQPPSSAAFEQGVAEFKNDLASRTPQVGPGPYATLEGFSFAPPDVEKEILSTYVPMKANDLTTYSADDAKKLVDKLYSSKGKIADMKQSPTNSNVFYITGVRDKSAPIVYEEPAAASKGPVAAAGENTIMAPTVYTSENEGLDPFFTPGDVTRDGKWDYTRFTPGLERSFAPNFPMQNWY